MNMKLPLLAASLVALGGCVAPGYDYVQPDYAGGGYYSGGYYDGIGGYYSDYYDGCCGPNSVSIGFGYGYGYPGYYDWGGYPYDYYGGYYNYDRYHHHHGDWDGDHGGHHDWDDHHGNHGGYDVHVDPAVQRWPDKQPWRIPDHPRVPHWNTMTRSGGQAPQPQFSSPRFTPHYQNHSNSGASANEPPRSWTPAQPEKPKTQQF
jgi:hypothetical protein